MPTNRIRRRQGRRPQVEELSIDLERDLLYGFSCLVQEHEEATFEAAWQLHRDYIRAKWRAAKGPGGCPFAEWYFEIIPKFGERPTTKWWTPEHEEYRDNFLKHGVLHTHTIPPFQQSEHEFLLDHGLIDEEEFQQAEERYADVRQLEADLLKRQKNILPHIAAGTTPS
jgi:hypothetical protein